ncbi:MAG TPA: proline dehydrogenase, partial [Verrucomicrobiaceae bacterium]
ASYEKWWREEFGRGHDHFRLPGQDNIRRYLPFERIRVRVAEADTEFEIEARIAAAQAVGSRVLISMAPGMESIQAGAQDHPEVEQVVETDEELAERIAAQPAHATERVRYAAGDRVPRAVRIAAAQSGVYVADAPVIAEGRIELLWYLREQSISYDYHRYGNLGSRAGETLRKPD